MFEAAINYLRREKDYTGYSKELGWVHAFAHGADFLAMASIHPEFPEMRMKEVWESTVSVFQRLTTTFQDGEERRLAKVLSSAVLEGKLNQEELAQWIDQMNWVTEEESGKLVDYYRYSAYENFLAAIMIQLEVEKRLSSNLKRTLINQLENY